MAVYTYKGVDAAGKNVKGVQDAESPKALRALLRRDGVLATQVLEQAEAARLKSRDVDLGRYFRRVSPAAVAVATRQLSVLLRAGIPLVESLNALTDQIDHPEMKHAFTDTRDKVNEGTSFADALSAHPTVFPALFVNMVAAGEASGTLEAVLARLADFLDNQAKLQSKVSAALAYPGFMVIITFFILVLMMTVVVPKVTSVFEDFGQTLPWYTQLLIFMSNMMVDFWWLLFGLLGGGIYGFRRWLKTELGRARWDNFILRIPVLGTLLTMVAVSRFARTLATLLRSGVPVLQAMDITRKVLGNVELMAVIEEASKSVREGEGIAKPLRQSGRFPPIVTHMIAIGERTGQLEEMLENVAIAYDQQVDTQVTAFTSLLEPLIIVIMGGMVASIAFAILMPLLQINQFAGG